MLNMAMKYRHLLQISALHILGYLVNLHKILVRVSLS